MVSKAFIVDSFRIHVNILLECYKVCVGRCKGIDV